MNRPVVKHQPNDAGRMFRIQASTPREDPLWTLYVHASKCSLSCQIWIMLLGERPIIFGVKHITSNPKENSRGGGFGGFFHGFLSKLKVGIGDATSVQKMIDQVCRLYVCLVSLKVPKRRKLIGEIETHIFSNGLKPPTNQVAKDYPRFAKCLCVCCFFRIFVHAKLPAWPENAQAGQTCHLWKFCVFFLKDGMCSGSDRGLVVSITTRWTLKVCVLHEIIRISFKKFWMYFLEGIFEMVSLGHFVFQQNHCSNSACH